MAVQPAGVRGGGDDPPPGRDGLAICPWDLGNTRPLTPEAEWRLAEAVGAGDREAAIRLVEANLGLVLAVARRYQDRGVPFLDLVSEGSLGLVRAVGAFDRCRGCPFATYAYWCIRQAIRAAVAAPPRLAPPPVPPAEPLPLPDALVLDRLRVDVHAILLVLTPRERRVLQLRYGLVDGRSRTRAEIGRRLGITRQRVWQIERLALARVRPRGGGGPSPAEPASRRTGGEQPLF